MGAKQNRPEVGQGIVDGSAAKPALRQDTGFWGLFNASVTQIWLKMCFNIQKKMLECGSQLTLSSIWSQKKYFWSKMTPTDYMVEKSYHLYQYLGPFGAYFMPQGPQGSK